MWHDVPNRGGDVGFPADSFAANDVQLLSGWQGDNAGGTSVPANVSCLPPYSRRAPPAFRHHYVQDAGAVRRDRPASSAASSTAAGQCGAAQRDGQSRSRTSRRTSRQFGRRADDRTPRRR